MDPLTQMALGATVGQAGFRRRLGRRAALVGAVAALLPDLDVVPVAFMGPLAEWRYHRGITHALWFGLVLGPVLGAAIARWETRRAPGPAPGADPGRVRAWIALLVLALVTHPLLDVLTVYGTQLLAPFSTRRFALSAVPIIDPVYTGILVAALAVGLLRPARARLAAAAACAALIVGTGYLFLGLAQNARAEAEARRQLAAEGVRYDRVRVYTTIFQIWLRRVVVRRPDEVWVGFVSTWSPRPIRWTRYPVPESPLVDRVRATEAGRTFEWFTSGETLAVVRPAERGGAVVELTDLRYGLPGGNERGFWGVRGVFDAAGRLVAEPTRFSIPRQVDRGALGALVRAAFGRPNDRY
ncbi:MAG TPA: metal-dependent hydrolase [Thermodesulfobacteriota bacterium]